ncbi:hypothetical protein MRX96_015912 [Rhipicephalus microplus]
MFLNAKRVGPPLDGMSFPRDFAVIIELYARPCVTGPPPEDDSVATSAGDAAAQRRVITERIDGGAGIGSGTGRTETVRRARGSVTQEQRIRFMLKREQVQKTRTCAGRRAERQFGCSDLGKHLAVTAAGSVASAPALRPGPPLLHGRSLIFRRSLTRHRRAAHSVVNS